MLSQHLDMTGGNVTACQAECQARSSCQAWRWHKISEQCSLARDTAWSCNVLAGPDQPNIDSCLPATASCDKFRDEETE